MILCFRTNDIINNKYFESGPDQRQALVSVLCKATGFTCQVK